MIENIVVGILTGTCAYMFAFIVNQPSPWYMTHKEFVRQIVRKGERI